MEANEIVLAVAEAEASGSGPNTIEYNVTRFVQILRRLGVRVSLAETVDALTALSRIEMLDRNQVRGVLRACLAKSRKEAGIFEQAFGLFFTTPEEKEIRRRQLQEMQAQRDRTLNQAEQELQEVMGEYRKGLSDKGNFTPQQLETFSLLPDSEKERMKDIIQKMKDNQINSAGDLINMVLQSSLNYWRYYMMKNAQQRGEMSPELEAELTGDPDFDEIIRGISGQFYHHPGDRILHSDMESLDDADIPRVTALINRMTSRLGLSISRRYRRSSRAVAVDIRRTIRRNMKYGGIPLELRYRARRKKRPGLLLICDVSASMARHARFVLQFIYGLNSALSGIESFIFSEDMERTTGYFRQSREFARSMTAMMNDSRQWGKSTNLCESLRTFRRMYWDKLGPDTIVFVVSDTKTVAPEAAAGMLREISRKCADVIWLNTLPRREWASRATVALFAGIVSMYECNTLSQLEKSLRRHMFEKI
ncbi:MAG TPA: VWA domain-containing protein [Spirochaetia bacterium]|nr:VWA domain-containing protein [Spirochaetia bacterium]